MCTVARDAKGPATVSRATGPRQLGASSAQDARATQVTGSAQVEFVPSSHDAFVARTLSLRMNKAALPLLALLSL